MKANLRRDGDTLWIGGARIRIAGIDTPELSPVRCERDRQGGMAAQQRWLEILNSGPPVFGSAAHDEDSFGGKLRVVYRGIDLSATPSSPNAWPGGGRITSQLV